VATDDIAFAADTGEKVRQYMYVSNLHSSVKTDLVTDSL
jgi:hypothetical protein